MIHRSRIIIIQLSEQLFQFPIFKLQVLIHVKIHKRKVAPSSLIFFVLVEESLAIGFVYFLGDYFAEEVDVVVDLEVTDEVDVVYLAGEVAGDAAFLPELCHGAFESFFIDFGIISQDFLDFVVDYPVLFEIVFSEKRHQICLLFHQLFQQLLQS